MSSLLRSFSKVCVLIGAYSCLNASHDLYLGYYKYYQQQMKDFKNKYGNGYIIITGGTEGLGKSYAEELASLGYDLIIISRNSEKLSKIKEELMKKNVNIETIPFDFSSLDTDLYEKLGAELSKYKICSVINNAAAFSTKKTGDFSYDELKNLISVNCLGSVLLNKTLWTQLNKKNEESAIINIGSQYVDRRSANRSQIYFSTKYFTNIYSQTLAKQIFKPKIHVSTVYPGLIRTKMFKQFHQQEETFFEGLLIENPDYLAKQSLRCVGYENDIYGSQRQAFMHYLLKYIVNRFYEI